MARTRRPDDQPPGVGGVAEPTGAGAGEPGGGAEDAAGLWRRAEEQLAREPASGQITPDDLVRTLHELRVHQIELELQNEQLLETQVELERTRAKYRDLYDFAPVGYVTLDDAGGIVEANRAALQLLDGERHAVLGTPLSDFVAAADQDALYLFLRGTDRREHPHACEVRLRAAQPPTWLRLDATRAGEELAAGSTRVTLTDVTAARRAQEVIDRLLVLRDSAEAVAHIGTWSLDLRSGESHLSPELLLLLDAPTEAHDLRALLRERVHALDRGRVMSRLDELARTLGHTSLEFRIVRADGGERLLEGEGVTQPDADGQPAEAVGYLHDVTEQRATEARIAELQEMRDTAERVGRATSWTLDLRTGNATWSPGAYALYDIDEPAGPRALASRFDEIPAHIIAARVHPDDAPRLQAAIQMNFESGAYEKLDFRVVHRDGSVHVLSGDARLERDEQGRPLRLVGYQQDVTEQRRMEAELRRFNDHLEELVRQRAAQLMAASREVESFVYAAAHDLRTPLRAIDGFSEIVAIDAAGRLDETDQANLQRVREAAQRMGLLLDHLATLSHAASRQLRLEAVDVSALAAEVCAEVCGDPPERPLDLVVAPGLTALADRTVLRAVLAKLVDNARKFTSTHESARIEVGAVDLGGETAFFVRDDGIGFDTKRAAHIFAPFQRLHEPGPFPGEGVGLPTVQRLVVRHGGRVWAESEVEKGATFYFTLGTPDGD